MKTNVVTAVQILEKHSADSPLFAPLLAETAESFQIGQVSADKAYGSLANFEAVADCGGDAYIPFKEGATGCAGGMFQKAFHFFQLNQEEYMAQYHKRSNVESTFSAIKRKFGDSVLSKTDTAMKNEVLCKILCHNLSCLIMEQEVLGIIRSSGKTRTRTRAILKFCDCLRPLQKSVKKDCLHERFFIQFGWRGKCGDVIRTKRQMAVQPTPLQV